MIIKQAMPLTQLVAADGHESASPAPALVWLAICAVFVFATWAGSKIVAQQRAKQDVAVKEAAEREAVKDAVAKEAVAQQIAKETGKEAKQPQ